MTLTSLELQDFSISELEGDIYDIRKRKFNDSDGENEDGDEKPSKKKSKKKQKPEKNEIPGKYVLLKPQTEEDAVEVEEVPENSVYRTVRKFLLYI